MPQRQSKRSTQTPVMASPVHSRRSADSDEELGRSKIRDDKDWEFLVGTAISVYQNSGGGGNNWSQFEEQRTRFGQPTIEVGFARKYLYSAWIWDCMQIGTLDMLIPENDRAGKSAGRATISGSTTRRTSNAL